MRLQLRKQQAEAGDIILLYGDESEALTHPYLARAWAKTGADLRVPAPGQAKKVALLGSLDHAIRELVVHTSPTKRSSDFVAHLEQLDRLYGPKPGQPLTPVVLVEEVRRKATRLMASARADVARMFRGRPRSLPIQGVSVPRPGRARPGARSGPRDGCGSRSSRRRIALR